MQRTVTKRLYENVVDVEPKTVVQNQNKATMTLADRNQVYQNAQKSNQSVAPGATMTLADRNQVYQNAQKSSQSVAPGATMTLADRNVQYETINHVQRRTVTNSRNELDFTKPFMTEKHRYFAIKQINSLSGEANLLIAKDEKDNIVLIKLYKMQLNETERRPLLNFLMNLPAGSKIMPVLDTGYFNNLPFEIIPYYKDGDITNMGPISIDMLSKVVLPQINEALHYMHHKGFIHRDIKPENIYLIKSTNKVVIGDFGITSTLTNGASLKATQAGRGTEGYVAPEVAQHNVTFATDYYSLGITICSLLLGKNVFENDDASRIFLKVNNQSFCNFINHENLRRLVCGLTLQDIKFRFGYQDVLDYCSNKLLRNVINSASPAMSNFKRPYTFEGKPCRNIIELGTAMLKNWPRALEHVKRGVLESFFSHVDESLCLRIKEYVEQESDLDVVLAKILVHFGLPNLINFKDVVYKDLPSFADAMSQNFPEIQENLMKVVETGILKTAQEYLYQVSQTKKNKELLDFINSAYECYDVEVRYYLIVFGLSQEKLSFEIEGKTINDLGDFVELFKNNIEAPAIFRRLLSLNIIQALLLTKLDSIEISNLINEQKKLDDEELYYKFLEILSKEMSIKNLYKVGFEEWLLNNVDQYKFNKKASELKNKMIEAYKKTKETNEEIFEYIELRKELANEFVSNFNDDIYINSDKNISTSNLDYYPVINYMNYKVTYKYLEEINHPNLTSYKKSIYQDSSKDIIRMLETTRDKLQNLYNLYHEDYKVKATSCDRKGTVNHIRYSIFLLIASLGIMAFLYFNGNIKDEYFNEIVINNIILLISFIILNSPLFKKLSKLKKYNKILISNSNTRNSLSKKISDINREILLVNEQGNNKKSKIKIDEKELKFMISKNEKELMNMQKTKIDKRKIIIFSEFLYLVISSAIISYSLTFIFNFKDVQMLYPILSSICFGLLFGKLIFKRRNIKIITSIFHLIFTFACVAILVNYL